MNEITRLLKEMLLGDEPYDAERGRQGLEAAIAHFDGRTRAARRLFGVIVALLFAATVWLVVSLATSGSETPVRILLLYSTGIVVASTGVGMLKGWYFNFHQQIRIMKEIRSLEARLRERD